ncbi:hypothetical protein KAFR_0A00960 [Kazachstania africana CBS 2517]|uniref:Uncharacterized protein n=1 Tax=Kazachstania africana (strain ATCC 22294 / BCRC 22015 / CBS 2517 / CECT 1963 / NBRC 1671 / NRRL Y-8276) TaxID=1071382 RepID=H2AMD4_KAZAF|nr:hypothetical protein KAFR_0A00960 [Kazachstania africana CBS 2517]CCF55534.1 hypothetical protein KAFR_0A00960 [Kazachstania africana CBS 2517]
MVSMENRGNEDFVDRVFDLGTRYIDKCYRLIDSSGQAVVDRLKDMAEDWALTPSGNIPERTGTMGGSMLRKLFPGLNGSQCGKSQYWLYGLGTSATVLVLFWKLASIPSRLPQNESLCVLILGDMSDPIVRSQVMDLYARRFTVFICSENAEKFKKYKDETDFLIPIDASSSTDLQKFIDYLNSSSLPNGRLASILFMPNLSYQPSGELSMEALQYEIKSNILISYNTLIKLLPHLLTTSRNKTQLILFNPSLSYNLQMSNHPTELFISGFVSSIYHSLQKYDSLNVMMIHLGLFQIQGQLSNYKYLKWSGSSIQSGLHSPVYKIIMSANGTPVQKLLLWFRTLFGRHPVFFLGRLSFISTWSIFPLMLRFKRFLSAKNRQVRNFFYL